MATENIKNAGFSDKVKIILGRAADSMKKLEPDPPFDFIFIDADKPSNSTYFAEAKRLVKKGGVIVRSLLIFALRLSPQGLTLASRQDC